MTVTDGILSRIFSEDVLSRLARIRRPVASQWDADGARIRDRHQIIGHREKTANAYHLAFRRSWAARLRTAERSGLFDDHFRTRLTGTDDDGFRSALAEALVVWYLAQRRRALITPNPNDKSRKNFDFCATRRGERVNVEVKAPYIPIVSSEWGGDDSAVLADLVTKASGQFPRGQANLLAVAPLFRTPISMHREQLVKATIGEHVLRVPVSLTEAPAPRPHVVFVPGGKLAKLWREGGTFTPRHTRVSAVMTIEEQLIRDRIIFSVFVVHNPFAKSPITPEFFGSAPQLLPHRTDEGIAMRWSDGESSGAAEPDACGGSAAGRSCGSREGSRRRE